MKKVILASTQFRIYSDEEGKIWHLWDNEKGSDGFIAEIILAEGSEPKFVHGRPEFMLTSSVQMSSPCPKVFDASDIQNRES